MPSDGAPTTRRHGAVASRELARLPERRHERTRSDLDVHQRFAVAVADFDRVSAITASAARGITG